MITSPVLFDTGPLVAILNKRDQFHASATRQAAEINGPMHTTWSVISEAAWLLRKVPRGLERLLRFVQSPSITCLSLDDTSVVMMLKAAAKY